MPAADRELLTRLFRAGLAAVDPAVCLPPFLPRTAPAGRTIVIGAGKAAAAMAAVVATHQVAWGLGPISGAVVTRYGHGLRAGETAPGIDVLEAGHPVPDEASLAAGARLLSVADGCTPDDRCIALLSGGASALLVQPRPGVTLADKQAITRALLASGAPIGAINMVRRQLSAVKGGDLGRRVRAGEILLYAISDVPGDTLADIGSGPFSPDPGTGVDALRILEAQGIVPTPAVRRVLSLPAAETPLPPVTGRVVAASSTAIGAVVAAAEREGFTARILPAANGPAREAAREHARVIRHVKAEGVPTVLVSGGETTVRVASGAGRGGRNTEFLLALALELGREAAVHALAADTDGIDGTGGHAGAYIAPDSLARGVAAGLDGTGMLAGHDSASWFDALGDLLVTGPTRTNVNDLRIALVA